jgi:HD superfamily phosphohydrolase
MYQRIKGASLKTIRDPVHGDIELTDEEMRVIDTPEFQRLRGVRQLGTSNLVFPGAMHTRFEHSLGTCWLAKRMIEEINRQHRRRKIDKERERLIAMAALLHDITHIPFGHTFEDERRILPAHDKSTKRLDYFLRGGKLGKVLAELDLVAPLFDLFLNGKKAKIGYPYQIVAGPICADLLDYLRRDAYYCGLNLNYDDRIFRYLDIERGQLCFNLYNDRGFRQDAWSELISLLRIRYLLTERVYFHHTKMTSGAMLSRILEAMLEAGAVQVEELYKIRDDSFLYMLESRIHRIPEYQPLLEAYLSRQLYKRAYMVARDPLQPDFPKQEAMDRFQRDFHLNMNGARAHLEQKLAKHLGVPASAIIIYAPDTNMRLKEARVMIRKDAGQLVSLSDFSHPELDALRNRHRALWKFFVFIDGAHEADFVKASKYIERVIKLPNQLELLNKGQLTLF